MMRADRIAIYSSAAIQGAILVLFASLTGVFGATYHYHLRLPQYGALFIPQVVAGVLATMFSAELGCRLHARHGYVAGLGCSLAAMALLVSTEWAERQPVTYPLLLVSTALVGAGWGLTFPYVRCYAVGMNPLHTRHQILRIDTFLSVGMVLGPVYALLTARTGIWWSLPVVLGILLVAQMFLSRSLHTPPDGAPVRRAHRQHVPPGFRIYPGLALLFGICAISLITAPHYLTGTVPSARNLHTLVLVEAAFWAAIVSVSRIVFAYIDGMKSRQHAASLAVFMIAIFILVLSALITSYGVMHVALYLLAGIGCGALLPIDTRPGQEHIAVLPIAVASGIVALYPAGLGLARFAYNVVGRSGVNGLALFLGVAVVGAAACLVMLPVVLGWRTLAYFDRPAGRNVQALAVEGRGGSSGTPESAAASGVPPPRGRPPAETGGSEQGGASALPHRGAEQDPRKNGQ